MRVTNSNKQVFKFTEEEMRIVFMYAFGYADISHKGYLPIDIPQTPLELSVKNKLQQCFEDKYILTERVIRGS